MFDHGCHEKDYMSYVFSYCVLKVKTKMLKQSYLSDLLFKMSLNVVAEFSEQKKFKQSYLSGSHFKMSLNIVVVIANIISNIAQI